MPALSLLLHDGQILSVNPLVTSQLHIYSCVGHLLARCVYNTKGLLTRFFGLQMETYQHQLKEHQTKLQKAAKQAQDAAAKATAQQQVRLISVHAHITQMASECVVVVALWVE